MVTQDTQRPITKTICQLGFRRGQQSSKPATTASGFDRKATRNPQLHIVPSVNAKHREPVQTDNFKIRNLHLDTIKIRTL